MKTIVRFYLLNIVLFSLNSIHANTLNKAIIKLTALSITPSILKHTLLSQEPATNWTMIKDGLRTDATLVKENCPLYVKLARECFDTVVKPQLTSLRTYVKSNKKNNEQPSGKKDNSN